MEYLEFKLSADEPLYVIGVVSRLVHMPIWTLRQLDKKGLIKPKRINKKTRCYSLKDIQKLEYIHYLMEEKGVNIEGVKIILEMEIRK